MGCCDGGGRCVVKKGGGRFTKAMRKRMGWMGTRRERVRWSVGGVVTSSGISPPLSPAPSTHKLLFSHMVCIIENRWETVKNMGTGMHIRWVVGWVIPLIHHHPTHHQWAKHHHNFCYVQYFHSPLITFLLHSMFYIKNMVASIHCWIIVGIWCVYCTKKRPTY